MATVEISAQVTAAGGEISVDTTAAFQAAPAASSDEAGDFVVAWQKQNSNGGWDVFARLYTRGGVAVSAPLLVNNTTGNGCRQFSAVASDAAGNFVVAWQSDQTGQLAVFARLFDNTGHPQGAEFQVNTSTAGNRQFPAVAMAPDGRFFVAWQADGEDGSSWGVYGQAYARGGAASGSEIRINSTTAGAQHSPAVAFLASGLSAELFAVVWQSEGKDGAGAGASGIYMRNFDGNGTAQGAETAVNLPMTGAQGHPKIASDPSGNFVVVWESLTAAGSGVYARRFNSSGAPLAAPLAADAATLGAQRNPAVACDALGNFVVTWDSLGQDGSGTAVLAEQFDDHQALQGGKVQLNITTAGDQSFAVPVASAGGNLWIAWQSQTPAVDSSVITARVASLPALSFYTLATACRLLDTRNPNGALGGPILTAGAARNFPVLAAPCSIPATAKSLSLNVTVTGATSSGNVTVYPGDAPLPSTSTINFNVGQTMANNAVIPLSRNGDGSLYVRSTQLPAGQSQPQVHVILDVNGYFQ